MEKCKKCVNRSESLNYKDRSHDAWCMRYYVSDARNDGYKRIKPIDDFNCEYFIKKTPIYYFGYLFDKWPLIMISLIIFVPLFLLVYVSKLI